MPWPYPLLAAFFRPPVRANQGDGGGKRDDRGDQESAVACASLAVILDRIRAGRRHLRPGHLYDQAPVGSQRRILIRVRY
jgi:hypothetical protein